MRTRLFALSSLFLFAACLRAYAQSLEGAWVTVLDVSGVVYPHVEELRIARDGGVVTAIYGIRHLPECTDKPPVQAGPCSPGQRNVTGQLAIDTARQMISIIGPTLSGTAMRGIGSADDERLARELFWFGPGEPWTFRREADVLAMTRRSQPIIPNTPLDGSKAIVIQKQFYLVDAGFAGDLVVFTAGLGRPLLEMVCLMPFISGESGAAREFRTLMRDLVVVFQKLEELKASILASPSPSAEALERLAQVMSTLHAVNGAPSTEDMTATATALGVTVAQVERFVREIVLRPHATPADALSFSMLKTHETEIRACHKQYFE
jgi:hypothetical protein